MFKHNLILTIRNFKRFKSSFFINLFGLSTGLACTMLIYLWVLDEVNTDKYHANDERLFQVMEHQQYAENIMTTWSTPGILAEALKEEFPDIEYAATTTWVNKMTLTYEDKNLKAEGWYTGSDFFNIFSYDLLEGDTDQVLLDKNKIVISDALALKIFGTTEELIGKSLQLNHDESFLISGIYKKMPASSSTIFDFVIPFEKFKEANEWVTRWGNNGPRTYVTINPGVEADEVTNKIAEFVKTKNEGSNVSLFLKKYSDNYLYGRYENGHLTGGRIEYVKLFSIIAVFILLIACINFMNLSTARASRRAKEVGIKKAVGAPKSTIITQYMTESLIMSLISFVTSIVIVYLFLPQFNDITGKEISTAFGLNILSVFFGLTIFTGIISGSYPAIYLSSFTIVKVLKGDMKGTLAELWARKGLVVFQFTLSIILIVSVLVIYKQIDYVQSKSLGYNKDNMIYFSQEGKVEKNVETFLTQLKSIPGIVSATSTGHTLLNRNNNTSGLEWEGKDPDANILFENVRTNYGIFETLGMEFKEGRPFSRAFSTDTTKIIFNEAAIKAMNLENPIGQTITLWEENKMEIIGVVKDFHFQSLHNEVKPLFFILAPENTWHIMARIQAGIEKQTLAELKTFYEDFNAGFAFEFEFMDETYKAHYAAEQRVSTLSRYFAGMAIAISCLGLFGLASFTAERRQKEIGIRKVLGSSVMNIVYLLSSDFTKLVGLSILLALPISYYLISDWLDQFAFRISLEAWFFIGAGCLSLLIAWLTVGSQALRAAHVNPAECLRDE
ncbi:ABC-type antimicrobial peptide transport system, permease component [Reichenbachiella faecimaris]|uniref:ABC-type antimicrobial peptide transport system, permease component n=1 Tax=Reichenbachiella faecimaris TaxID=692418 RepID=A0A1W2G7H4_REIFA|nr:ABC transporter permease [Reichenbachiella faecimaris]SMD32617.1 ABC-type antimicrobial peptide transport system, permease component [Reichenbachiella faecimaris]